MTCSGHDGTTSDRISLQMDQKYHDDARDTQRILDAAQAIAREIELDKALSALVTILMTYSGADTCRLVSKRRNQVLFFVVPFIPPFRRKSLSLMFVAVVAGSVRHVRFASPRRRGSRS